MWILSWTIQLGRDDHSDRWAVHESEAEALAALDAIKADDRLYCWAVSEIKHGSEPHYVRA